MKVFRYKEDRLPIFIIFFYFVIDLIYYFKVDHIPFLIAWCFLGVFIKGIIAAWNHNHQHFNTFKIAPLNRALEVVFGMYTGICGYAWVLHHNIGHHSNYLDQKKDESRWKNEEGKTMHRIRYSLEVFFTSYYRCFIVGLKHKKVLMYFLAMTSLTLGVLSALTYYRPLPALLVLWIPCLISLLITADSTYEHHSGLDTNDPLKASRNTVDTKCFNVLTGNFGYHTAHHMRPAAHWTKLPAIHAKVADRIPPECYVPNTPFFALVDYLVIRIEPLFKKGIRSNAMAKPQIRT
jgi:fatty acid desaturase